MAYAVPEARWLVADGFEDVYVAYPSVDRAALAALAASATESAQVTLTIDSLEHVELLAALDRPHGLRVALDVDASLRMGPLHLGVRRSPLREPAEAVAVARAAAAAGLSVVGPDVLRRPDRRPARLLARRAAGQEALRRLARPSAVARWSPRCARSPTSSSSTAAGPARCT